jgi:isocitrate dehydrogenase kinase/phosphatase
MEVVIKHVYIERRMIPLNIYLQEAFDTLADPESPAHAKRAKEQLERAVVEYGNAIKDLVAANIFPGDMLWKNFGVTRNGKVVFYDYDEIEYLTDCNFRKVPTPRNEEEEMSGEVWYSVGPKDVFPETFEPFLLGNPRCARPSCAPRRPARRRLLAAPQGAHPGRPVLDVFPYEESQRFQHEGHATHS